MMELNEAGSWTLVIAIVALVALGGTTLTAANSGMVDLQRGSLAGIAIVLVTAVAVIAASVRRIDR